MSAGLRENKQERRGGLDLEHRDRRVAVLRLAFGERRAKLGIADKFAAVACGRCETAR